MITIIILSDPGDEQPGTYIIKTTMKQIFNTILIKRDNKLEHTVKAKEGILKDIIKELPEGTKIEVFANTIGTKGSNAQLAKIHAMIRQLANDLGEDPITLKHHVKNQAMIDKSFADCDIEELNSIIQAILTLGDWNGSNLR
jgi:transcription termination factor NusB